MTKKDLYTRLYNAGTGEWVRRGDRDEMLRVAALCIEALDELQKRELELAPGGSQTQPNIAVLESGTETASQVEPKGEHPTSRSFRDLADSHEAQGFNDMIAFTPTALRRFADQIDAIHTPEADRWVLAERLLRSAHSELALEPDNAALTQRIGEWLGLPENREGPR